MIPLRFAPPLSKSAAFSSGTAILASIHQTRLPTPDPCPTGSVTLMVKALAVSGGFRRKPGGMSCARASTLRRQRKLSFGAACSCQAMGTKPTVPCVSMAS